MKRRRTRKTTEIEVETQETTLTWQRSKPMAAWCPGCARESAMDTPEAAAHLASVSVRKIYQWVEAGKVHFSEMPGGPLLVCLLSVRQIALEETGPGLQSKRELRKTGA